MTSLFDWADSYPRTPGHKERTTSRDAARMVKPSVNYLRQKVLDALATADLTADEIGEACGQTPFAIRPRCTELIQLGRIKRTGLRRRNASGMTAHVLTLIGETN